MKKIRWGIVSTARIAHQFADDFAHVSNGELVAVASRTMDAAREFAAQHGIPRAYSSYAQLYADPDIDAVYVATPHSLHLENAGDALRAGKAVLCEKPLALGVEEVDALTKIVAETNGYLMEAMWTWFLPAIQEAHQWFRSGRIGELRHIKADFGYPMLPFDPESRVYKVELGGGVLQDMGIYPVAINYLFTQSDPVGIDVVAHHAPNGVEDDVVAVLNYGTYTSTLATSFRCKLPNTACIVGDEGHIVIPDFWCARECHLFQVDKLVDSFNDGRQSIGYDFETVAVGDDLLAGRAASEVMPLSVSRKFQQHLAAIKILC